MVDLLNDVPACDAEGAAHLLAALAPQFPKQSVFLCVVDPGVGGARDAIVVRAEGRTFAGPDNGLLSVLWQRARRPECWRIRWRPKHLSTSFHGRDLFAPVVARLAARKPMKGWLERKRAPEALLDPCDLARVIYIDHYGNAVTGIRAENLSRKARIFIGRRSIAHAPVFEAARGPFWYENSMGLVEIAVPRASAARKLGLRVGYAIRIAR